MPTETKQTFLNQIKSWGLWIIRSFFRGLRHLLPQCNDRLKGDICKIVLDKGLFAIILVSLSLLVNHEIDRYRSELSVKKELNIRMAEKIGLVWENIYLTQDRTDVTMDSIVEEARKQGALRNKLDKGQISKGQFLIEIKASGENVSKLSNSQANDFSTLRSIIEQNRFWLGEKQYSLATNYLKTFLVVVPIGNKAYEDYKKKVEEKRAQGRIYLNQIRDDILMNVISKDLSEMTIPDLSTPPAKLVKIPPKDSNDIE